MPNNREDLSGSFMSVNKRSERYRHSGRVAPRGVDRMPPARRTSIRKRLPSRKSHTCTIASSPLRHSMLGSNTVDLQWGNLFETDGIFMAAWTAAATRV